jgi:hypothetical protein
VFGGVLKSSSSYANQQNKAANMNASTSNGARTSLPLKKPPLRHASTNPSTSATTTTVPSTPAVAPYFAKASAITSVFERVGTRFAADPHAAFSVQQQNGQNAAREQMNACSPFPADRVTAATPLRF